MGNNDTKKSVASHVNKQQCDDANVTAVDVVFVVDGTVDVSEQFVAALQHLQQSAAPAWLQVVWNAGHSQGTGVVKGIANQ